jgi:hypothetical protein
MDRLIRIVTPGKTLKRDSAGNIIEECDPNRGGWRRGTDTGRTVCPNQLPSATG